MNDEEAKRNFKTTEFNTKEMKCQKIRMDDEKNTD